MALPDWLQSLLYEGSFNSWDRTEALVGLLLKPLQPYAVEVINQARARGIPLIITESYRTQSRQASLYAQGRTKPGAIVTDTLQSYHTLRRAFDVAISDANFNPIHDGREVPYLRQVGTLGMAIGWRWGGVWKLADLAHFEF